MIYTGNYEECNVGNLISISGDKGRSVGFVGKSIMELAPKKVFWNVWKENIGKIPEEENTMFYVQHYYDEVLSQVDVMDLLKDEVSPVLLCYEKGDKFCHRHVLAEYIQLEYGIIVNDVKIAHSGIITINPRPAYIKQMLLQAMNRV
ncbi:MAG: DUF488 family protein [Clostridia bacterium]|nr:DUF488 family protein [Clostridia bacterium]